MAGRSKPGAPAGVECITGQGPDSLIAGRLRTALARISSADLTKVNGLAPAFLLSVKASIQATSSLTEPKLPRRMAPRLRMPNQVSIWFIEDAEVGVKWNVIRGRSASRARTASVFEHRSCDSRSV